MDCGNQKRPNFAHERDSLRDLHSAIARSHGLAFGVPDHETEDVRARCQVERTSNVDAGSGQFGQSLIAQAELDDLLQAADEIAIAIEDAGDDGQLVIVAIAHLAIAEIADIDSGKNGEFGLHFARFEELEIEIDGDIVKFFARIDGFADLIAGLFFGIDGVLGRGVTAAGLQSIASAGRVFQSDFELMKAGRAARRLRPSRRSLLLWKKVPPVASESSAMTSSFAIALSR